jgi:hypothetical protein
MKKKYSLISILFVFISGTTFSQDKTEESLFLPFKDYTKIPREVAYAHLNKSTYIIGETIGFTSYVFDKNSKKPSTLTSNLYCTLSDSNKNLIKSKLILVENGVSNGTFFIDSLFTSGTYTFKAYTNWMKNFDEQNFYMQTIKIIDPEDQSALNSTIVSSKIDAQFLPEGGHLIANTENTIGVVVKDSLGFGIPYAKGQLLEANTNVINVFKTNEFGVGKFTFIPKDNTLYKVALNFQDNTQDFELNTAKNKGIALSLTDLNTKVALTFNTNKNTLAELKNKPFKLAIHDGSLLKVTDVIFEDTTSVVKLISYNSLSPGINIFTLFDENDNPLLERIFFNYEGISLIETKPIIYSKLRDSLKIKIPMLNIDPESFNNFSISVLPEGTKSDQQHHNILSYTHLQPYLNGYIENGSYYFTNISRKKKYELDNLLLTQGWSSYDWHSIFNNKPDQIFEFETGISFTANINKSNVEQFILYPLENNGTEIFEVEENQESFERKGLFPVDFEKIKIGEIRKNERVGKSGLYLQFTPSKIPNLEKYTKVLPLKQNVIFASKSTQPLLQTSWGSVEQLDEIVLNVKNSQTKLERLRKTARGTVDVFDDTKRLQYFDFASYISAKGFRVNQTGSTLTIINTSSPTPNNRTPIVFLDDMLLSDFSLLVNYNMTIVDYILIDKSGLGEGIRGSAGVIKIYTDPSVVFNDTSYNKTYQEIDIPLTFSKSKKLYAPKYSYYQSQFYREFGVIDWFPNCKTDDLGNIIITIEMPKISDIKLQIEGIANNGSFISEEKHIIINK